MDNIQFRILEERLKNVEELLQNLQPKQKKPKQVKISEFQDIREMVKPYENKYSPSMLTDFIIYWSECDRWKKEKVFDISKRLERWKRQQEKWDYERSQKQQLKSVDERPIHREYKEVREGGFNSIGNLMNKYEIS